MLTLDSLAVRLVVELFKNKGQYAIDPESKMRMIRRTIDFFSTHYAFRFEESTFKSAEELLKQEEHASSGPIIGIFVVGLIKDGLDKALLKTKARKGKDLPYTDALKAELETIKFDNRDSTFIVKSVYGVFFQHMDFVWKMMNWHDGDDLVESSARRLANYYALVRKYFETNGKKGVLPAFTPSGNAYEDLYTLLSHIGRKLSAFQGISHDFEAYGEFLNLCFYRLIAIYILSVQSPEWREDPPAVGEENFAPPFAAQIVEQAVQLCPSPALERAFGYMLINKNVRGICDIEKYKALVAEAKARNPVPAQWPNPAIMDALQVKKPRLARPTKKHTAYSRREPLPLSVAELPFGSVTQRTHDLVQAHLLGLVANKDSMLAAVRQTSIRKQAQSLYKNLPSTSPARFVSSGVHQSLNTGRSSMTWFDAQQEDSTSGPTTPSGTPVGVFA